MNQELQFDILFSIDKSLAAGGLAQKIHATQKYGFGMNSSGVIEPLSPSANYQYQVGLDDQLKFFGVNKKNDIFKLGFSIGYVNNLEFVDNEASSRMTIAPRGFIYNEYRTFKAKLFKAVIII